MLSLATKLYILSKCLETPEDKIDEEFILEELNMNWDEFEELDNEEFYDELVIDDRESFITIIFDYNDIEFIDFIGGFQELEECSNKYYMECIQDFLIKLFTYEEEGEIEVISNKEYYIHRMKYHLESKIVYPLKSGLLKLLTPFVKRYYEIEEIPFCLELMPIKDWREELALEWILENDIDLDDLEEN